MEFLFVSRRIKKEINDVKEREEEFSQSLESIGHLEPSKKTIDFLLDTFVDAPLTQLSIRQSVDTKLTTLLVAGAISFGIVRLGGNINLTLLVIAGVVYILLAIIVLFAISRGVISIPKSDPGLATRSRVLVAELVRDMKEKGVKESTILKATKANLLKISILATNRNLKSLRLRVIALRWCSALFIVELSLLISAIAVGQGGESNICPLDQASCPSQESSP